MNPSAAFFCLWMVVVYSAGEKLTKTKRDVSGLYPFPRVGKGDASWTSQIIGPREMKRQGLIPFPRVGRNRGNDVSGKKRDVAENGGGMWFGPRLGRLQKRNYFDEEGDWALVQIKDFRDTKESFTPNLSKDSSEETDQMLMTAIQTNNRKFIPTSRVSSSGVNISGRNFHHSRKASIDVCFGFRRLVELFLLESVYFIPLHGTL